MAIFPVTENPLTRRDADEAQQLVDVRTALTVRLWAAHIWAQTGLPTAPHTDNHRMVKLTLKDAHGNPYDAVEYLPVSQIAKQGSMWDVASGGRMAQWCLLLDGLPCEWALLANKSLAQLEPAAPNLRPRKRIAS